MFIKPYVRDFIQNHKDAPSKWEVEYREKVAYNKEHNLIIEFHRSGGIYGFHIGGSNNLRDKLNFIEKYLLKRHFLPLVSESNNLQVPTIKDSPELFI